MDKALASLILISIALSGIALAYSWFNFQLYFTGFSISNVKGHALRIAESLEAGKGFTPNINLASNPYTVTITITDTGGKVLLKEEATYTKLEPLEPPREIQYAILRGSDMPYSFRRLVTVAWLNGKLTIYMPTNLFTTLSQNILRIEVRGLHVKEGFHEAGGYIHPKGENSETMSLQLPSPTSINLLIDGTYAATYTAQEVELHIVEELWS